MAPTASSLLGDAAPCLGQLHTSVPEDAETLERLRQTLQVDWKLLQTTGEFTTAASHNNIKRQNLTACTIVIGISVS